MSLQAQDICFRYPQGKRPILNHVNLTLSAGQRLGLSAPSGFGKTTLCKILAGYEMPDQGQVLLDGRPLASYSGYCPVQLIWQHPEQVLNPRLRLRQTLLEAGIAESAWQRFGIEQSWLNRFPGELSSGELQRFCLARALGKETKFILADEITTMLDLLSQSQIWHDLLAEIEQRQIGLLAVSHSESLLAQVCDELYRPDA